MLATFAPAVGAATFRGGGFAAGRLGRVLNADDVAAAAQLIAGQVRRTPTIEVAAGELAGVPLVLKLELLQRAGSFKARGAFHFLLRHRPSRVVTASGGNHGLAVAVASAALGVAAEVFVPAATPAMKLAGLRRAGATVHQVGEDYAEAAQAAVAYAQSVGVQYLHAYDDPAVVAGQGTAALELMAEAPDADSIVVAVGGGGLLAGTIAALNGRLAAVGVEPQGCPTLHAALSAGAPVDVAVGGVAVDSLGARRLGALAFDQVRAAAGQPLPSDTSLPSTPRLPSDTSLPGTPRLPGAPKLRSVLVPDEAIMEARRVLWRTLRLAVEPAAAAGLAALRCGAYSPPPGARPALLLCGGNADPGDLSL